MWLDLAQLRLILENNTFYSLMVMTILLRHKGRKKMNARKGKNMNFKSIKLLYFLHTLLQAKRK